VVRNHVYDALELFDFPDPAVLSGDRNTTTIAPQALFLMNSDVAWEASQHLAERLLTRSDLDDRSRIEQLYEITLGREPTEREIARGLGFVKEYEIADERETASETRRRSWQALCQAVCASNEFAYLK
jgi:hypothetical protein